MKREALLTLGKQEALNVIVPSENYGIALLVRLEEKCQHLVQQLIQLVVRFFYVVMKIKLFEN